jgi:DNA-binding protein H-NS
MQRSEYERMSNDELWALHVEISKALAAKLAAAKEVLERRLELISGQSHAAQSKTSDRRPSPPVLPKFRNPDALAETWTGRGRQPRWLTHQLKLGRRMEDFEVRAGAE